jgi:serine/threonine protein phosphatase PrpC
MITSFGKSDVGLKRSHNEDAFVTGDDGGFAVVADGMGGAAAGEVASRIFVETAAEVLSRKGSSEKETVELVQQAFSLANTKIFEYARANSKCRGMGCTAEAIIFFQHRYVVGHVGDSRTYLFRHGKLKQITKDDSLVEEQRDQGLITDSEARKHPHRNIILRAVGIDERLTVDIVNGEAGPGDYFLLCSDGLTDMVDDPAMEAALSRAPGIIQQVENLIALARSSGGHDNITVVLCKVTQSP